MADYQKMYTDLSNEVNKVIGLLQKAQLQGEETFIITSEEEGKA